MPSGPGWVTKSGPVHYGKTSSLLICGKIRACKLSLHGQRIVGTDVFSPCLELGQIHRIISKVSLVRLMSSWNKIKLNQFGRQILMLVLSYLVIKYH